MTTRLRIDFVGSMLFRGSRAKTSVVCQCWSSELLLVLSGAHDMHTRNVGNKHRIAAANPRERTARPHEFWLLTCGLDTYAKGSSHARKDTPWNAFTADRGALVCTLWTDLIVEIYDSQEQRRRCFIKLGQRSTKWKGLAIWHGKQAELNYLDAIRERKPIFGFEGKPNAAALKRGQRSVDYFWLDRAHQLKSWIGLTGAELNERLHIEEEFRRRFATMDDPDIPGRLFELVEPTSPVPGAASRAADAAAAVGTDTSSDTDGGTDSDSERAEVGAALESNRSADEYARPALRLLVAHVLAQTDDVIEPLTYRKLAELLRRHTKHGDPWPRGLGHVLGRITALVDSVTADWPQPAPFLTTIVVLTSGPDAGLPATGVSVRWSGWESLSKHDKQAKLAIEYERIARLGPRWNDVLQALDIEPVPTPPRPRSSPLASSGAGRGGWGGGESEQHTLLKRYVLEHPGHWGATPGCFAQPEFPLRSGDEVDVIFKTERLWIGVEVKSRVSDALPSDYERGLYQVVKYRAVLTAQAHIDHPEDPPEVHVLLVLESRLPQVYRALATSLGVDFRDGVDPCAEGAQLALAPRSEILTAGS